MTRILLLVGTGGFIGSIARVLGQQLAQRYIPISFPVGTIVVNIIGSFVIGLVYGLSEGRNYFSPETKLFLVAGICGGFTTFSSFSMEIVTLMRTGEYLNAFLYITISILFGIGAAFLGFYTGK